MKTIKKTVVNVIVTLMSLLMATTTIHGFSITLISNETNNLRYTYSYKGYNPDTNQAGYIRYNGYGASTFTTSDGRVVFCIEPWAYIDNGQILESNTIDNQLSDPAVRKRLALVGYYGWESSAKTLDDRIATQFMVWEARGFNWTQSSDLKHYPIQSWYVAKRAEINQKINDHSKTPAFTTNKITLKPGESYTFTDTNNVLSKFMTANGFVKDVAKTINGTLYTWNGSNSLTVTATTASTTATMSFANVPSINAAGSGINLIFESANVQRMAHLQSVDPTKFSIDLTVVKQGNIKITKTDPAGKTIAGTAFKLSSSNTMSPLLGTYTTGADGTVTINNLDPGTYYVQESTVPKPYVLETTIHPIIVKAAETTAFTKSNQVAQGQITIKKVDSTGTTYPGAVFSITNASGTPTHSSTVTTGTNGIATSVKLPLGTYIIKETQAPSPLVLDSTPQTVVLSYVNQTTALVSQSVTQTNHPAQGQITITKKGPANENVPGAIFAIRNPWNQVVDTVETNSLGVVTSGLLPLGTYTVQEIFVSYPYIKEDAPQTVTLEYKNQTTPVISANLSFANKTEPILTTGIRHIQIDTKKSSEGLTAKVWLDITQNYDWKYGVAKDSPITIQLINKSNNEVMDSKTYTAQNLPSQLDLKVAPNTQPKDTNREYEARIVGFNPADITVVEDRISTLGYTSSEQVITGNAELLSTLEYSGIIRTQRSVGQPMETFSETVDVTFPPVKDMRSGYGFDVSITARYNNELGNDFEPSFVLDVDSQLVDNAFLNYPEINGKIRVPLEETANEIFELPRVMSKRGKGEIYPYNETKIASDEYLDGGRKIYVPIWETDLGNYQLNVLSAPIGVNEITFAIEDSTEVYAFMNAHFDSETTKQDAILLMPINWKTPFGINNDRIPDNWGYEKTDGTKDLTYEEKTFFEMNPEEYAILYNLNGGISQPIPNETVKESYTHTVTSILPTRAGHDFNGWKYNGTLYHANQVIYPEEDITFKAEWDINTYTVTYNANGGTGAPADQTKVWGTTLALSHTQPTRTGYTFIGWNTAPNGSGTSYLSGGNYTANTGITLYAQWDINAWTVTYNANGGSNPPASQAKIFGTNLTLTSSIPSRPGYTFNGWNTTAAGTGTNYDSGGIYTSNANITLYAKWTLDQYTVTFNSNGGTAVASQSVSYGSKATVPANPTRTGYTFAGWSPDIASTTITRNTTFYAQWSYNTYTVTYNANGGTGAPATQVKTHGTTLTLSSSTPSRSGYRFNGWNTNAAGTGTNYAAGTSYTANSSITLYAQWVLQQQYIFVLNGFAGGGTSNAYGFGTQTGFNLVSGANYYMESSGSATQTAINNGKKLVVFIYPPGWAWGASNTINHTAADTRQYGGTYFTAPSGGEVYVSGYMYPSGGTRTGTVTWNSTSLYLDHPKGGSIWKNIDSGSQLTLPQPQASKTGHSFSGWYNNQDGKVYQPGVSVTINAKTTFSAQWTANKYTVTFNSNGGTAVASQSVSYGATATAPANPTRSGYTFAGWSPAIASTTITGNTTFTAQWTANTYTVTYSANGGTGAPGTQSFIFNSGAKISSTVPTRSGYTFSHWTYSGNNFAPGQAIPTGWGSFTLTAQWTPVNYTITYNGNGISGAPTAQTKTHGTGLYLRPAMSTTYYTFHGWNTNTASTGTNYGAESWYTREGNITLYANWSPKKYTVTFNSNGGTAVASQSVSYGSKATVPANPTRTGYTFAGWSPDIASTTITRNTTFYAQWKWGNVSIE